RLALRQHRQLLDALHVVGDPVDHLMAMLAEFVGGHSVCSSMAPRSGAKPADSLKCNAGPRQRHAFTGRSELLQIAWNPSNPQSLELPPRNLVQRLSFLATKRSHRRESYRASSPFRDIRHWTAWGKVESTRLRQNLPPQSTCQAICDKEHLR